MAPHGRNRTLVLLRHGRTAWNAEGRAQGHADVSLDALGRAQAEAAAPVLAELGPSLLWSSDLARARETAAFLEKETGLTAREDPRLREYDVGERTGLTVAEFGRRIGRDLESGWWDTHAHVHVPGAESTEQVSARMVPALREVLDALADGETAVVVTHGAALRVALAGILGWSTEAADGLETLRNCGWAVLREAGPGRLRLATYNATAPGAPPD
jgi:probable phosphoglycerate mutase